MSGILTGCDSFELTIGKLMNVDVMADGHPHPRRCQRRIESFQDPQGESPVLRNRVFQPNPILQNI